MLLRRLQNLLGGIYDVRTGHDIYDFLITDRSCLPREARSHKADEQLLVAQGANECAVSLYIDPDVLMRLQAADPLRALHSGNVADFWTVLEGVSHFQYLAWNARHDKQVSLHELELQAEIDKYVSSFWMLRRQQPERFPAELARILFGHTRIDPVLAGDRAPLYRAATRQAERFCRDLEQNLRRGPGGRGGRGILASLRRFYRLTDARKLAHIERL